MFVYKKGKLRQDPIIISEREVIYRLTHESSGMNIEVKFNPLDVKEEHPYKVFKEVDGVYTIYKEFLPKKLGKNLKETFEMAIDFFEDNIFKSLNEKPPQAQAPNNQTPAKQVVVPPEVNDVIRVGKNYGIVTDVVGSKVITRNLTKEEALSLLRAKQNAQISIARADIDALEENSTQFKKGGVLHQKPAIGDVVRINGNYGLVTDIYGSKIETKNISKEDALRILKQNKNG
jgi:hypothetical protein